MAIELELKEMRQQRRMKFLLIAVLVGLALFFIAALMHIGAGDAEWGGMSVSNVTPAMRMEFGIPKDEQGVVVNWCEGEAYKAGVRSGDLIKAINNQKIYVLGDFLRVARAVSQEPGFLLDLLRNGQPLYITMENKLGLHDKIKKMLNVGPKTGTMADTTRTAGQPQAMMPAAFANRSPAETAEAGAIAPSNAAPSNAPQVILPTPKEQGAALKELVEGHWLGMELIPTTPELSKEYGIPPDTKGLLVDEIALESAESGILAGDMVVAVDGFATPDLLAFTEATRRVKNRHKAQVLVSRRGQLIEFTFSSVRTLGFSQNEAAQPITPGALSPHRSRNQPCTSCHIIMITGGQLPTDAGDILPSPPPIVKGAVAPHEDRGRCNNCHVILKKLSGTAF
ncbi:MAG: magnetochrome domain-containing protein [Candidatus Omnitrophica bacterium]|nr:magnetochrome domain-containing protein [Candidatus Omnitrophota bacterium]